MVVDGNQNSKTWHPTLCTSAGLQQHLSRALRCVVSRFHRFLIDKNLEELWQLQFHRFLTDMNSEELRQLQFHRVLSDKNLVELWQLQLDLS